ncbi:ABC-F family ATP-binding cassette domain-containing protein [Marinimicrobium alkaliphilum]|uniref:ABC-F family ATP-binding cassette domain-containing protein n=1 Tax=Marinimicrobium alkaliphilum TaxID=2202654 RepID=UPI000DB9F423|nr:ATP-binding cassette domain-containing protein [Marinimicrobium alkaliphilum]
MIQLQHISLQRGAKFLLNETDLNIFPGQKLGIIGPNGSGKSSLFKLLLGELASDTGTCELPRHWRIAHMAQELKHIQRTALESVLDGDTELRRLEAELAAAQARDEGEQVAKIFAELERIQAYSAPARAQQLLKGLGFAPGDDERPVSDFSGGWRIRLNLAKALMCPSDLLLLDEPTNHLDLDATYWLEQWLKRYSGTLLVISHDRDFLDNLVEGIVSLEGGKLISYSGNYSGYERQRAERLAQQQASFEKQQARKAEIEDFVRRFRAKATKARQAQSRLKELERMEEIAPAHVDSPFTFRFPCSDKLSSPLANLSQASLGYPDAPVLSEVNLSIVPDTRIGLLGPNGAGKSTLIKTLAGTLELLAGERHYGEHFSLGYFAQHQLEALDLKASAALHIQRLTPSAREQEIRNFLGSFGFQGDRAFEPITHFSGGEKARLALAIIAWQKPNVLLLDEPTNHLDLEVRHALTLALQEFEGAVIVVSHDRHLLRNTVDEFVLVAKGRVEPFDGTLDDYHRWLLAEKQQTGQSTPGQREAPIVDKKAQRQQAAAQREKLKPLTNRLKTLERDMEKCQKQLAQLESELADPDIYDSSEAERLKQLLLRQGETQQALDALEEEWLEVSETLEATQAGDA